MAQTTYQAPLELMQLALRQAAESTGAVGIDGYAEVLADLAPPVLENAARFAGEVLSPLTGCAAGPERHFTLSRSEKDPFNGWNAPEQ